MVDRLFGNGNMAEDLWSNVATWVALDFLMGTSMLVDIMNSVHVQDSQKRSYSGCNFCCMMVDQQITKKFGMWEKCDLERDMF